MTEKDRNITLAIKKYFKVNHISQAEAARRLDVSRQTVSNRLYTGGFTDVVAASWNRAFGFNEHFLITGKGTLIKRSVGYQKIVKENDSLNAIIRAQKRTIEDLKKEIMMLKAQSAKAS